MLLLLLLFGLYELYFWLLIARKYINNTEISKEIYQTCLKIYFAKLYFNHLKRLMTEVAEIPYCDIV